MKYLLLLLFTTSVWASFTAFPPTYTPAGQITATTANSLTGYVNGSTGAVISSDYSFLTSCSRTSQGNYQCDFSGLGLTQLPSLSCNTLAAPADSATMPACHAVGLTTTNTTIIINRDANDSRSYYDSNFNLYLDKQGADVTKEGVIDGIPSVATKKLIRVKYRKETVQTWAQNAGAAISYDKLIYTSHPGSLAAGYFTAPHDAVVKVCSAVLMTSTAWGAGTSASLDIVHSNAAYGNTIIDRLTNGASGTVQLLRLGSCVDISMDLGDSISIHFTHNTGATQTLYTGSDDYNYFTISEIPEEVVDNP